MAKNTSASPTPTSLPTLQRPTQPPPTPKQTTPQQNPRLQSNRKPAPPKRPFPLAGPPEFYSPHLPPRAFTGPPLKPPGRPHPLHEPAPPPPKEMLQPTELGVHRFLLLFGVGAPGLRRLRRGGRRRCASLVRAVRRRLCKGRRRTGKNRQQSQSRCAYFLGRQAGDPVVGRSLMRSWALTVPLLWRFRYP